MKQPILVLPAATALTLLAASNTLAASGVDGVWMDDTGRGAVEIKACGSSVCGHVVAVKNANDTKGCGKQIIGDAQPSGSGLWSGGWIYSPEKRRNYDVELKPLQDGTLRVVGYAGTKLFSRTMIWTRAPLDLRRCDAVEAKAPAPSEAKVASPESAPTATPPPATEKSTVKPDIKPETKTAATPDNRAPPPQPKAAASTPADPLPQKSAPSPNPAPPTQKSAEPVDDRDDNDGAGEKPGERKSGGGLNLGDLDLDKVLTRTASGKCKLDLPWVKVQFDCDRE